LAQLQPGFEQIKGRLQSGGAFVVEDGAPTTVEKAATAVFLLGALGRRRLFSELHAAPPRAPHQPARAVHQPCSPP
jgi:hypothetical protein